MTSSSCVFCASWAISDYRLRALSIRCAQNSQRILEQGGSRMIGRQRRRFLALILASALAACGKKAPDPDGSGQTMQAGRNADSFPAADENYFHDMDGGVELPSAVRAQ
jgi:hypothetical protein